MAPMVAKPWAMPIPSPSSWPSLRQAVASEATLDRSSTAIETAEKEKIPYHLGTVERGGTDGGRFSIYDTGVPTLVIFIPTRYIHSHTTIMDRKDHDASVRLVAALAKRLDKKTVASL